LFASSTAPVNPQKLDKLVFGDPRPANPHRSQIRGGEPRLTPNVYYYKLNRISIHIYIPYVIIKP